MFIANSPIQAIFLLFLCNDPALGIHKHPVTVAVVACRDMVVVGLSCGTDDLAAWQAEERDHGCQILEKRRVVRGKGRSGKKRHECE